MSEITSSMMVGPERKKIEPEAAAQEMVSTITTSLAGVGKEVIADLKPDEEKTGGVPKTKAVLALFRILGAKDKAQIDLLSQVTTRSLSLIQELKEDRGLGKTLDKLTNNLNIAINTFLEKSGIPREHFLKSPGETLTRLLIKDKKKAALINAALLAVPLVLSLINPEIAKDSGKHALLSTLMASLFIGRVVSSRVLEELPSYEPPRKPVGELVEETTAKVKKGIPRPVRLLLMGCGIVTLIGCCVLTAAGVTIAWPEVRKLAKANAPALTPTATLVPENVSVDISHQNRAIEMNRLYREDSEGENYNLNPFDIDMQGIIDQTAYIGPTWAFWPERQALLEKIFNKKFTPQQIEDIRNNPKLFINLLKDVKVGKSETDQIKIQRVIEFYQKRINSTNPQQFLDLIKSGSYLIPGIPLTEGEIVVALNNFLNESKLLQSGVYQGRKGSFANTGLPKSEVLRRQGYKV